MIDEFRRRFVVAEIHGADDPFRRTIHSFHHCVVENALLVDCQGIVSATSRQTIAWSVEPRHVSAGHHPHAREMAAQKKGEADDRSLNIERGDAHRLMNDSRKEVGQNDHDEGSKDIAKNANIPLEHDKSSRRKFK